MRATVGIALNGLVGLAAASKFDWTTITPSEDLEYHDCFDGYKCARLIAPLDYKNESDSRTIALAMIKLPAVVPDDDASFAGSVFTNPGGPGASGIESLLGGGKGLRDILDKPGRRHYEIVSFDPRGISNSWPRANCFAHDNLGRDAALLELRGRTGLKGDAVPYVLALQKAIGQRCQDADESGVNGGQILGYMSTPNVARDMVHMVDKIAELRAREADDRDGRDDRLELKRRSQEDVDGDVPRLQYIGYSYGTVLGNYFASMFPGRVGRLMLDGVVNARDYSSGPVRHDARFYEPSSFLCFSFLWRDSLMPFYCLRAGRPTSGIPMNWPIASSATAIWPVPRIVPSPAKMIPQLRAAFTSG